MQRMGDTSVPLKKMSTGDDTGSVKEKAEELWHSVVHWTALPHWQRDNQYIHSGYRKASYSYPKSFTSILHWHNESVNIWSHLIPAVLSLPSATILYHALQPRYVRATEADVYAMGCFFVGAAICLGMSATFHTVSNHSPKVAKFWNQLDYVGIAVLITGSFIPSVYYGFWCEAKLQRTYWIMICTLGAGCVAVSLLSKFRTPTWRPFRALMFIGMGLSALFPVLHGVYLYGFSQMNKQIGLSWLVLQGTLYIVGASIYAMRFPERVRPGQFDNLGASHQIFHVFVVLAAISHLFGLLKAFDYRHGIPGALCI